MLNAAATYRALEIVCRASAIRELASLRGADRTASVWLKLADEYAKEAGAMISTFRPPAKSVRPPQSS